MMPKVSDGIGEEVLQVHVRAKPRVPTSGIGHRQSPLARTDAFQSAQNGGVNAVEPAKNARSSQDPGCGSRSEPVDPMKTRGREVEEAGERPSDGAGEVTEEYQQTGQREDEEEPEEDVKEHLPVRPPRIVAGLAPALV